MKINFMLAGLLLLTINSTFTQNIRISPQTVELSIGDRVPSGVWESIPKKDSLKLVILDFWSTNCSGCLAAFPKMDQLQKDFPDKLQIVLINSWEDNSTIKERLKILNKRRTEIDLSPILIPDVSLINNDTIFKKLFNPLSIPHHVWLDNMGYVLYITEGYNATSSHVQKVLNGEAPKMALKMDFLTEGFDPRKAGVLGSTHAGITPAFYSGIIKYNTGLGAGTGRTVDSISQTTRINYFNFSFVTLYKYAFNVLPGISDRILLEVKDKTDFVYPKAIDDYDQIDEWKERNMFSYEIVFPSRDQKRFYEYMQADLNNYFRNEKGIEGGLEKRNFPCFIVVRKKDGFFPNSNGGKQIGNTGKKRMVFNNYPIKTILQDIRDFIEDMSKPIAFVDETGFDYDINVDMELTGDLKDVENLRKQLQKYGLDIIQGERELEVLVIKDKIKL